LKVLRAIQRCRTPALGGHLDHCSGCGHSAISLLTPAGIGTAQNVRRKHASDGSPAGNRSCSVYLTFMWCSPCLMS
jgi:hypothetical protein